MASDLKQRLLSITLKHIQGRVFEADEFYKALEPLGAAAVYAEALVDIFWLLWVRFEVGRGPESMNLVAAIKACWQDKRVSEKQLLQVLEPDCLHTVGLVRDKSVWDKKAVRYNTKLNYTILKYNLLREDSEGYAKLITLYNHFGAEAVGEQDLSVLARELHSLIGSFDLDPNRCLDLLLDAAAQQPENGALLGAVQLLKAEAVGQLMGFKLQQYQDPSRPPAPRNLLLVAAQLISSGRTSLPELLAHLSPSDELQAAGQRAAREALMKRVGEIGQINLGGAGGGGVGGEAGGGGGGGGEVEGRDRGGGRGAAGQVGYPGATLAKQSDTAAAAAGGRGAGRSTGLSAAYFELDPSVAVGPLALGPDPRHNQPLALLDALLQVGAWDAAIELHDRLVAQGATPAAHPLISSALCSRLAAEVGPAYNTLLPGGLLGRNVLSGDVPLAPGSPPPQLSSLAHRLLGMLGLYIHTDIRLFTKVVRLVRYQLANPCDSTTATAMDVSPGPSLGALRSGPGTAPSGRPAGANPGGPSGGLSNPLEDLLSSVLLPATACCPVHLPLAADVWECVKLLPVQNRYRVYAEFRELAQTQPLLQAAWRLATVETKKVLKRLVLPADPQKKKEACRPHARMVAKVAHVNPLPVMEAIVSQIEVYDNQIEVSLEALKYLSPFSYDVLTFVILSRLALERDKVKEDGVNISGWLQALAKFTGAACRRFSDLDVGAVLQFLVNTLRAGDSFDLLVLQQIIVAMTGVRLEAMLSDEQLDALSGGPELVAEAVVLDAGEADAALGMGRTASAKDLAKGRQRLLRALEDPDCRRPSGGGPLVVPLLVLTAQQRSIIVNHTDSKLIKFIATMYDRCQDTLLHLTEFLRLALPVETYATILPTPDMLRREYGIDVEVVWHIYRPIMARLLDAAAPQPAEEGELEEGEDGGPAATTTPGPTSGGGAVSGHVAPPGSSSGGGAASADVGGATPAREEPRVGDKTWSGVLAELPACATTPALWSVVTPDLYATFWSLQLTDIYVPIKRYEKELSAVKDQLQLLENNYLSYIRPGLQSTSGYVSNNLQQQYETYKAEKVALQEKQTRLSGELEARRRHVDEVRQRLVLQRANFFLPRVPLQQPAAPPQQPQVQGGQHVDEVAAGDGGKSGAAAGSGANGVGRSAAGSAGGAVPMGPGGRPLNRTGPSFHAVVQEMFLPRLLFSAADALYCARLLLLLHHTEVRHFSIITFLDSVLRAIPVLRSLTEVEANNMGVFLFELLKQMVAWHRDEKLFMEECVRKTAALAAAKQPHNFFKSKMMLWHGMISSTFRASLESGDYTQIANALSVMGRLVTVWPGTIPSANSFRSWVERLQKEDPREDIKTMARSYLIALSRETEKPGRMVSQIEYGGPTVLEKQRAAQAAGASARGGTGSSPAGAASKVGIRPPIPGAPSGAGGSAAAAGAAGGDPSSKPLNAAARPFVPKVAPATGAATTAAADGGAAGGGAANGVAATESGDAAAANGKAAAAAAAARKRPRTEGADRGGEGTAAPADKVAADGAGKKPRVEAAGGGEEKAAGGSGKGRGGGGGGDRDGDTYSDAGGRATSETSGRVGADGAGGGGGGSSMGGKEGRSEKEHKEHKRSKDKDKDREKERGGKDKDRNKGDKEHRAAGGDREDKEEARREEKERRREEKERERAEKAEEAKAAAAAASKAANTSGDPRDKSSADKDASGGRSERGEIKGGRTGQGPAADGKEGRERDAARSASVERSRGGLGAGGGSGAGAGSEAVQATGSELGRDRSSGRDRNARDRHGGRRSAANDDPDTADGNGKRRRLEPKSDGGASPSQGTTGGAARGGSSTPDLVASATRRATNTTDVEMEYDERGGFALPPAPRSAGGGGGNGAVPTGSSVRSGGVAGAGGGSGGGAGGGGGGGLPPSSRSGGAGEGRRRGGR